MDIYRSFSLIFILIVFVVMIITVPVLAGDSSLNLEEILNIALDDNIDLDIGKLKLENARIEYQKNMLSNLSTDSRLVEMQGEVNKMIAEQNYKEIKQNIVLDILRKYLDLIVLENEISLNEKEVKLEKRKIKEIEAQVETGYKGTLDLFTQQNLHQAAVNELERNSDRKKRLLKILKYEISAGNEYEIDLISLPRPEIWDVKEEVVVETALNNSKALKISENKVKLAEADYEKASIRNEPKLSLKQKENNLVLARLEYRKEKQSLEENIMILYSNFLQSVKNLDLTKNNLKQAQKNLNIIKEQKSRGLVTDNDVLEAEVEMLRVENDYINSISKYHLNKLKLKQGLGVGTEVNIYE